MADSRYVAAVKCAAMLPMPRAAFDVVTQWISYAEDNAASFAEQAILDAERGDIDAALYASSAAEFSATVVEQLRALCADITAKALSL